MTSSLFDGPPFLFGIACNIRDCSPQRNFRELGRILTNIKRYGRIHDFSIARFPALRIHKKTQSLEDEKEFAVLEFDTTHSVHCAVRKEGKQLIVRVDQS